LNARANVYATALYGPSMGSENLSKNPRGRIRRFVQGCGLRGIRTNSCPFAENYVPAAHNVN
jgi:hypothetical protein